MNIWLNIILLEIVGVFLAVNFDRFKGTVSDLMHLIWRKIDANL